MGIWLDQPRRARGEMAVDGSSPENAHDCPGAPSDGQCDFLQGCRDFGSQSCAACLGAVGDLGPFRSCDDYIEGDVSIDGTAIHPKFAEFPDVKAGQLVATAEGRAEILLTPGVFLRMAENTSVRMLSNALADTRLEVVSGSALVEVGELLEHNAISFDASGAHMELAKKGLYRIDASPANLRVYQGQARVISGSGSLTVHKGHQIDLGTAKLSDTKFDAKETDAFYRWNSRRAAANVTQQLKPNAIPGFHDDALYHTVGVK